MANTPTIFLSYSWANTNIADEIDNDFQITGITMRRDVRDVPYRKSIKDFMKTIAEHDYVLVLISSEFIQSANCMYEVMELLNEPDYKEKILPILVPKTNIFSTKDRIAIIKFWSEKKDEALNLLREVNPTEAISIQEDLKHYTNICANIDTFISHIKDTNCKSYEELRKEGYKPIFELIGYDPKEAEKIELLIKIQDIEDEEEQDLELEKFLFQYPNDYRGWFVKGNLYSDRRKYKISRLAYEKALEINPRDIYTYNNYAVLLINHFGDKNGGKKHYERMLELGIGYAEIHYNYAKLLIEHFGKKEDARKHYEMALKINPGGVKIHNNYALLLKDHFDDKEGAKRHYEKALEIDAGHATLHYNYAKLLIEHFDDKRGAKKHYEKVLEINPKDTEAHCNYANLLIDLEDLGGAKSHYEKALEINPMDAEAHCNLAGLLNYLHDIESANEHYLKAIELKPELKTPERDEYFGV